MNWRKRSQRCSSRDVSFAPSPPSISSQSILLTKVAQSPNIADLNISTVKMIRFITVSAKKGNDIILDGRIASFCIPFLGNPIYWAATFFIVLLDPALRMIAIKAR